jgi:hypothetical protein
MTASSTVLEESRIGAAPSSDLFHPSVDSVDATFVFTL